MSHRNITSNILSTSIDINSILSYINTFVLFGTMFFYLVFGTQENVNETTLFIYSLLAIQTHLFLKFEKKNQNPFLILIVVYLVFFNYPKIITLYWDVENIGVIHRMNDAVVADINNALEFIFFANLMLFLGLCQFKNNLREIYKEILIDYTANRNLKICFLVALFIFIYSLNLSFPLLTNLMSIILYLISPTNLIIVILTLIICNKPPGGGLLAKDRIWYVLLFINIFVLSLNQLASGSRSAFFVIAQSSFIIILSCNKRRIKTKYFLLVFILILISFVTFSLSTSLRSNKISESTPFYERLMIIVDQLKQTNFENVQSNNVVTRNVIDRIIYLDYTIDMLKNYDHYVDVINVSSGLKSAIDGLTPGFDLFDAPKLSNALSSVYYSDLDRLKRVNNSGYQSDQFNIYGEFYVLFGAWFSLPFFCFFSYLASSFYRKLRYTSYFRLCVWKSFYMITFASFLTSFGFDWCCVYAIMNFISIKFILYLIDSQNKRQTKGVTRKVSIPLRDFDS